MTSVGRDMNRFFLIKKLIPTILEKWPFDEVNTLIRIPQDNARTRIDPNDDIVVARSSLNIKLTCQPPNSHDLNALDLGYFNAIKTLHHKEAPRNINDLIKLVGKAFDTFPTKKSNHIFLTLQKCMIEIIEVILILTKLHIRIKHVKKKKTTNSDAACCRIS